MFQGLINSLCIGGIVVLFFLYWVFETRVSQRYRKRLEIWTAVRDFLSLGSSSVVGAEKLDPILDQAFIREADLQNGGRKIAQSNGRFLLSQPLGSLLPGASASPYRYVPALLTTIGVLGTFTGISLGLSDFNAGGDSKALMQSAWTLLSGMKTAFYTSLAGLLASIAFMLILGFYGKKRERAYRILSQELGELCITLSPVALLHNLKSEGQEELVRHQMQAAKAMVETSQRLSKTLGSLDDTLGSFNSEKIANNISEAVRTAVKEEVAPPLTMLPRAVAELKAIKEENGREIIQLLTAAIRDEVVQPVMGQTEVVTRAVTATNESVERLAQKLDEMVSGLGSTTETLNEFQRDTMTKLQNFAVALKDILSQFKDDTEGTLDRVAQEINSALASAIDGMGAQRTAFEQSADRAASAFEQQNQTLEKVGEASSQLMGEAKHNLLEGLSNIDDKVRSMSAVVQQELETFRIEYQNNLQQFFSQQENLLENTLGKQREGLAGVVADFRKAFEDEHDKRREQFIAIAEQYEKLQQGTNTVSDLVNAVGMAKAGAFSQLEDAAKAVGSQVGKLRVAYEEGAERFNKLTEQMPDEMDKYFRRAQEVNTGFFDSFDEAAHKVHSRLAEAANLLVTAMQTLEMQRMHEREEVS